MELSRLYLLFGAFLSIFTITSAKIGRQCLVSTSILAFTSAVGGSVRRILVLCPPLYSEIHVYELCIGEASRLHRNAGTARCGVRMGGVTFVSQNASTPDASKTCRRKIASRNTAKSTRFPMNTTAPMSFDPASASSHRDELSVSWIG